MYLILCLLLHLWFAFGHFTWALTSLAGCELGCVVRSWTADHCGLPTGKSTASLLCTGGICWCSGITLTFFDAAEWQINRHSVCKVQQLSNYCVALIVQSLQVVNKVFNSYGERRFAYMWYCIKWVSHWPLNTVWRWACR